MKTETFLYAVPVALLVLACGGSQQEKTGEPPVSPTLTEAWKTDTVFTGSESALYDPGANIIYVSNGNTEPGKKDNDGYISVINTDGTIRDLRWVEDNLHAPKGMAMLNGKLYVSDIDEVKVIDVASATIDTTIPFDGAKFLNDLATDGQQVYVSDSGSGTIYALNQDGTYAAIVTAAGVNGLEWHNGHLYALDSEGLKKFSNDGNYTPEIVNSEVTGGDGLVILNDTTFIASRWQGEIYFIRGSKTTKILDTKEEKSNTADIGFVPETQLVIVPTFFKNGVAAYKLSH